MALAVPVPAFAASGRWSITSASYEGSANGTRGSTSTYFFQFTITVPAGVVVTSPSASFSSNAFLGNPAGNGTTITGVNPTGTVDGWTATGSERYLLTDAFRTFTFTRGTITGPATVTLNFTMNDVRDADVSPSRSFTFSSTGAGGPAVPFSVLPANVNSYITSPHV